MKLNRVVVILGSILILAFAVRVYHLHSWLYFQADQVRNTNHAHKILEQGWEGVPLLGPKAGGTDFHLGPVSYYFEVIPALIFGLEHPAVVVYSNLFFILVSVLLVYYFLRQGFSRNTSLQITTLYAFSYVVIQYSRFSWNPNSLLLWGLLFVLSAYKIFNVKQHRGKTSMLSNRGFWLLILAMSYGIVSQLHTTALLGYPGVFGMYWLYKMLKGDNTLIVKSFSTFKSRLIKFIKSISWRYWVGALSILCIMYVPVIIYDIQNNWYNTQEFAKAFSGKTVSDKSIGEKLYREINLMGKYYTLNIFSLNYKETVFLNYKNFRGVNFIGIMLLVLAISIIIYYRRRKISKIFEAVPLDESERGEVRLLKILRLIKNFINSNQENKKILKIANKKDFLMLNFIWWLVFFILFFPLAYKLDQMRFWFIAFLIPYVCLAIIFEWLKTKRNGKIIVGIIAGLILLLNLSAVANWYIGLEKQDGKSRFYRRSMTSTLQQSDWVTYEKMREAVKYMSEQSDEQTICFSAPTKYKASYRYIFKYNYSDYKWATLNGKIKTTAFNDCTVYLIKHSDKTTEEIIASYAKDNKIIQLSKPQKFGVITVWKVEGLIKN
jgi:hypothetical protein